MSLAGSLFKISEQELDEILETNQENVDYLKDSVDLSYFAIIFLDLLKTYSRLNRKLIPQILEGVQSVEVEDGYLGYSRPHDVIEIKTTLIDKIATKDFVGYLVKSEKNPMFSSYTESSEDKENLIKYFENIKQCYEEASHDGKCLLYRIG